MKKKFTCDRSITVTRLEDLLQDSLVRVGLAPSPGPSRLLSLPLTPATSCPPPPLQEEKDHLTQYQSHLAGLANRAKTIVQLKPRSASPPLRGRLPLQAVCDYKQVEVSEEGGRVPRQGRGRAASGLPLLSCPPLSARRSRCTREITAPS